MKNNFFILYHKNTFNFLSKNMTSVHQAHIPSAPVAPAVTHHGEGIATHHTQKTHFSVSTILLAIVIVMVGIVLLINIWYYWFSHSKFNAHLEELKTGLVAHNSFVSSLATAADADTVTSSPDPTPTIKDGDKVTFDYGNITPINNGSFGVQAEPGSTTRAGAITFNASGSTTAWDPLGTHSPTYGDTIAIVSYTKAYASGTTPTVILTNRTNSTGGVHYNPKLTVINSTNTGFHVIITDNYYVGWNNPSSEPTTENGKVSFYYQTFGISSS